MVPFVLIVVMLSIAWWWYEQQQARRGAPVSPWLLVLILAAIGGALVMGRFVIAGGLVPVFLFKLWKLARMGHGGWRIWRQFRGGNNDSDNDADVVRALAILGLEIDADRAAILAAHKRAIKANHPDQGGSAYLTAEINRARDILLRRVG